MCPPVNLFRLTLGHERVTQHRDLLPARCRETRESLRLLSKVRASISANVSLWIPSSPSARLPRSQRRIPRSTPRRRCPVSWGHCLRALPRYRARYR